MQTHETFHVEHNRNFWDRLLGKAVCVRDRFGIVHEIYTGMAPCPHCGVVTCAEVFLDDRGDTIRIRGCDRPDPS
jgi:hypothetical protein